GQEFLDRVASETSWQVRLITGEIEARLTYIGLGSELGENANAFIVDIGGGSTESIRVEEGSVTSSQSLRLGSGRLADRFFHDDPPGIESLLEASSAAQATLRTDADIPESVDSLLFAG